MKTVQSTLCIAIAALIVSLGAQAQTAASSPSREQVKKEAIEAGKAGQIVSGECSPDQKADVGACAKKPVTSTKSREEVKKEAAAATKSGETSKLNKPEMPTKSTSTTTRAEVKQDAIAAGQKGEIVKGAAQPEAPKK
jgi:Domain of unknown function (DUF4148)